MKKTLRIAALIMVLVLTCVCFASCKTNESKDENSTAEETTKTVSDETENVEKAAEDFLDAKTKEIDEIDDIISNCEDYMKEDSDIYEDAEKLRDDQNEAVEEPVKELDLDKDVAENVIVSRFNAVNSRTKYTIGDVKVDGKEATVEFEKEGITEEDFKEAYSEAMDNLFEKYVTEVWEEGTWEAMQYDDDVAKQVTAEFFVDCEDEIAELMEDVAKDLKTKKTDGKLTLEKVDGKWLVTEIDE